MCLEERNLLLVVVEGEAKHSRVMRANTLTHTFMARVLVL